MLYHLAKIFLVFSSEIVIICYGQSQLSASCTVPPASADKRLTITDINGEPIANARAGSQVPKGTTLDFQCAKGYLFTDGTDTATSFCRPNSKGDWQPAIKPCHRFCPPLQTTNVELTCKYNGRDVDCDDPLLSGTLVTPRCKDLHHVSQEFNPDYTTIRCRGDGSWSKRLFKCDPDCGVPLHQTLIIGGSDATLAQFPWHVAIYSVQRNHLLICGGTLIASNVVLTAAHCFYNETFGFPMTQPTDYVVAVGKITRNHTTIDNDVQKIVEVSEILFNDKPYNPKTNFYTADIAMIILRERVPINTYVLPACFRSHTRRLGFSPGKDAAGVLAGWGLGENTLPTEKLKTITLPFISYSECEKKLSGITHDKFCAGSDRGPRPQTGDSGGGLIFKDPNSQFYYVRGIVSTTEKFSQLAITTFTDISYYQEWIDRVIQEKLEDEKKNEPSNIVETQTLEPDVSQCCPRDISETVNGRTLTKRETLILKPRPASFYRTNSTSANSMLSEGQVIILKSMANLMMRLNRILSRCFTKEDNVLFAPFNTAKSLSVLMLGAGGSTELEMANAIGSGLTNRLLNKDLAEFHVGMGRLLRNILAVPPGPTVSKDMNVASGVFVDESYPVKQQYKDQAMKLYRTEVYSMNFKRDGYAVANFTNQWIRKKTFNGIKDTIIQPLISPTTKLMFITAVYFNGEWEYPFHKKNNKWQTFYLNADGELGTGETIRVEMMTNRAKILSYANEKIGFQAVGIPYKGGNVVMYVLLPELETSIEKLSCLLGPEDIETVIGDARPSQVVYTIPKMKLFYRADIRYTLEHLNATSLFDRQTANFSNMVEVNGAYMSDIVQVTYVEVNETLTADSKNTASAVKTNQADVVFHVNRPFIFFMYNIKVGIVTFWSSVKKPTPFRSSS